jgi:hypothetical protein
LKARSTGALFEYQCSGLTLELCLPAPVGAGEPLERTARPTEFELTVFYNGAKLLRIVWDKTRSMVTHFLPGDWERWLDVEQLIEK